MFTHLKNFICKLFNIKACKCDEDEHIEFVELKAKGGRAGYKKGGAAIRGVSKILR